LNVEQLTVGQIFITINKMNQLTKLLGFRGGYYSNCGILHV